MDFSALPVGLLAFAIFAARIVDVSIGTVRTLFVFRGYPFIAAALGFVEVLLWLIAAGQVFQNLDDWHLAVAYAGGFAAGNIVGIWLEGKLAFGTELVRAVSEDPDRELAGKLRERGYSVIELAGEGDEGRPVEVILVTERRKRIPRLIGVIRETDPDAYWTVNSVRRRPEESKVAHRGVLLRPDWIRVGKRK